MVIDYMNLSKDAWNNWLFNWIKLYASNDLLLQKAVQQLFWGGGGVKEDTAPPRKRSNRRVPQKLHPSTPLCCK